MKRIKKKVPGFDEIIFENRNKEYGAYDLRKRYKSVTTGLRFFIELLRSAGGLGSGGGVKSGMSGSEITMTTDVGPVDAVPSSVANESEIIRRVLKATPPRIDRLVAEL